MLKRMKVKIYPNQKQAQMIEQNIGNARFVWNQMLNMWNTRYQNNPNLPTLKKYDLNNLLPALKTEYPFLKESEASSLQGVCEILHGDLWGGNHMFLMNGKPALFDPHPLYGDREFDIGITTSFGTYPQEFYQAYQSFYPMAEGYQKRLNFYRLYIFMMHLHKFGGTYESRVNQTIQSILSH